MCEPSAQLQTAETLLVTTPFCCMCVAAEHAVLLADAGVPAGALGADLGRAYTHVCLPAAAAAAAIVILLQDMRYFFLMLVFLLVSFGLTFSVLMSPISAEKLSLVSLVADRAGEVAGSEVQVFGSLEVRLGRPWRRCHFCVLVYDTAQTLRARGMCVPPEC